MSADRTAPTGPTAVVPALARDYQRILRLFPFAYRRAHGAEMLGHLLDAAAPGQSRPARRDVVDLLRAAAREWALAPLGPTASERRAATGLLAVALPAILAIPATRTLGFGASLVLQDGAPPLLPTVPMVVPWAIWALAVVALLTGAGRTGRALSAAAAVAATVAVIVSVATGQVHAAYLETGWAVAIAAHALVLAEHGHTHGAAGGWQRRTTTAAAIAVAVGGYLVATVADTTQLGLPWWSSVGSTTWSMQAVVVLLGTVGAIAVLMARTRQAVPVLAGVATGVVLGRSQFFWSGSLDPSIVDVGNVFGLLAFALAAMFAGRGIVNRVDELAEVRAQLRRDGEQAVGPGTGAV